MELRSESCSLELIMNSELMIKEVNLVIYINGELRDDEVVNLDSGFYFGRGLFETMLVKNKPIFLEEHLDRINKGLKILGINKSISKNEVLDAVSKMNCNNEVLKLTVTEKNTLFTVRKNNYTKDIYHKGFKVKISNSRRNQYSILTYLKSLNYVENMIEHEKCIQEGYNEVLFFNTEGFLAEGSVSNVFFIKDKKIYTPHKSNGLLEGTVRKYIVDNYEVIEGNFTEKNLKEAEAVFLTNSVMGVMKVSNILGRDLPNNILVEEIIKEYNSYIKSL